MAIRRVTEIDDMVPVRHILASVSDKTGLADLAKGIVAINPNAMFLSTGGTFKDCLFPIFGNNQLNLFEVADYTNLPETEGGLVKTLSAKIYLGLLTETYCKAHVDDLWKAQAVTIDLVLVNLYPFEATITKSDVTPEDARGNIDIGGPSMIRAAAKNFHRVAVVVDPNDYPLILEVLRANDGFLPLTLRWRLAKKAFIHVTSYDMAIAEYLNATTLEEFMDCYEIHNPSNIVQGGPRDF